MKKTLIIVAISLFGSIGLYAQDIITKTDGTDLQAKILEITIGEIKYKKFSNLDGPTYTILKSEVMFITYENGDRDIFGLSDSGQSGNPVHPGMKYKEYKDLYNPKEYYRQYTDPYRPFWIGVGEFIIPGLGEACVGEWGRAAGFFFGNIALYALQLSQTQITQTQNGSNVVYTFTSTSASNVIGLVRLGLNIWGICDAVRIAKVKNMYNQDLVAQRASLDVGLSPYFAYTPYGSSSLQPVTGLSLRVSF
ncbi:MAG: hypothetical protein J6X39_06280 [Bacteroidales bacterium]|nr:hypothetical protein [Bacteroidales bacterium]